MPRAIWSGSISFGLISLPVKVYSATETQKISFDMLHDEDGAKIEYRRVCPVHDEVVPWEHIIKGYEIEPGKYVTFTKEELEALQPESTHTVDIEDFVQLDSIDPMFFDTPYFLVPEKGAQRAYALLHQVMVDAGVVAIARMVMRTRERLVALRPLEDGILAMETLHFADEIREHPTIEESGAKKTAPTKREVEMARSLVDELTVAFEPERYEDTWREKIVERIEQKAAGEIIAPPTAEEPDATPAGDIMAALEASLAAAREQRGAPAKRTSTKAHGAGSAARSSTKPKATKAKANKSRAKAKK